MAFTMDIGALQALAAIEECGGVTRAADHLALSQSAVSHKIKRLEGRIGRDLLSRRPGGQLFTEDGLRLLAYARRILALHDEAILSLASRPLAGKLRLGMTEDTTGSNLSRILGRFARRHPDVSVRTQVDQSLTLETLLDRGELDLAIMQIFSRDARPADIVLYEDSLHWVKSRDLRLSPECPLPFLAFDRHCFYRNWAMEAGHSFGAGLVTVLEGTSAAGMVAAIEAGLGVALLNTRHLTAEMERLDGIVGPTPPGISYVVRLGAQTKSAPARGLAEAIAEESGTRNSILVA